MRIFTKQFFNLSNYDQAAIVGEALYDLRDDKFWLRDDDQQRAKRSRQRIIKKAMQLGILSENPEGG